VVLFYPLPPTAADLYRALFIENSRREIESRNHQFRLAQDALGRKHIFSTLSRLALVDPAPAVTEPYLLSYMERLGKFDPQPILERVRNGEFDVVITAMRSQSWRGIPRVSPDLHRAIEASYTPLCTMLGALLHLPRSRPEDRDLSQELFRIGCVPV